MNIELSLHVVVVCVSPIAGAYAAFAGLRWSPSSEDVQKLTTPTQSVSPRQQLWIFVSALLALAPAIASSNALESFATTAFAVGLIFLATVDFRTMLVPIVPMCLLTLGAIFFGFSMEGVRGGLDRTLIATGSAITFLALDRFYQLIRGRVGLGSGDALLAAMIASWIGVVNLAWTVVIGSAATICVLLLRPHPSDLIRTQQQVPFGPGLALGAYLLALFGGISA